MHYRFLRFPGGKDKAVTLSYDDGKAEDIRFSETISKYGLKCTFNLNCEKQRDFFLTKEEIEKYFLEKGHEVAVHGAYHRAEGCIRPIEGIQDVLDCRMELEAKLGTIIRGMAYPDTGVSVMMDYTSYDEIKKYLRELDIVYARTIEEDKSFRLPKDWYMWNPTAHHSDPHLMEYIDEFMAINLPAGKFPPGRYSRLFFLWGHSFEFERDNNWGLLDCIAQKLSGNDKVWYATNIEIYEYVNAYNKLIYSADGMIVYNPTLFEIWFDVDGVLYSIKSGETLKING